MNSEFVQAWWPVVAFVLSAIGFVASMWVRSQVAKDTADIRKDISAQHDRITRLEGVTSNLPGREDVHKLALQSEGLAGDIKAVKAQLEGMAQTLAATQASVQRVTTWLLDEKGHT